MLIVNPQISNPRSESGGVVSNFSHGISGFHRERGGEWHWDFHPPGKVFPLQVLEKYYTANGMQVADFMWMKLLSIEYMI